MPTDAVGQRDRRAALGLNEIVLKACAWSVKERYASAAVVHRDLEALHAGRTLSVLRPNRWLRWAAAVSALALALTAAGVLWRQFRSNRGGALALCNQAQWVLRREASTNWSVALALYEQAVREDRNCAPAYVGLAECYLRLDWFIEHGRGWDLKALQAAEHAIQLQPDLAEAYAIRGRVHYGTSGNWNAPRALADTLFALRLNPQLQDGHDKANFILFHVGLLDEAIAHADEALTLNPGLDALKSNKGETLVLQTKFEEADRVFRNTDMMDDDLSRAWLFGMNLFYLGLTNEAANLVNEIFPQISPQMRPMLASEQAIFAAAAGNVKEAEEKLELAKTASSALLTFHHVTYHIGSAYSLLRRPKEAVHWLRVSAEGGFPCYPFFRDDPNLRNLHGDSGYESLLQEMEKTFQRTRKEYEEIKAEVLRRPLPGKR